MTPHQQNLIKESFGMVAPIAHEAAAIFYARLFELDPSAENLFVHTSMDDRYRTLMQTMTIVVKSIDNLDPIVPAIQALGARHGSYGVKANHFETAGQALIDTLGMCLGDAFTAECREAWIEAFGILSSMMIESIERDQSIAA
jgi:hemoglobin-like flavoprotein